jgi:5-methylcytosine-specific restriction protein A
MPVPKKTAASALSATPRQWYDARTHRAGRRTFSAATKRLAWARCNRQCQSCTREITGAGDIEYDHIVSWELSRDSSLGNCQILCLTCHDDKTAARDVPAIAKADRQADFHIGIKGPGRGPRPMPCGRDSGRSKTMRGAVVPRQTQAEKHRATMARLRGPAGEP